MMGRLIYLSIFFIAPALSFGQQPDSRLTLLVFKTAECPPCRAWKAAYDNPLTGLRVTINHRYRMENAILVNQEPAMAERYQIRSVPTFILVDSGGNEVHRVERFTSPVQLLRDLASVPRRNARPQQRSRSAPSPQTIVPNPRIDEVLKANKHLQDERDALERQLSDRRQYQKELQSRADVRERKLHGDLEAAKRRAEAAVIPERVIDAPEVMPEPAKTEVICENGVCEIPPARPPPVSSKRGFVRTILHHGVKLAIDFGLTQAQSEIAVPIAAIGGPTGVAAWAAFSLFKMWRRRKRGQAKTNTQRIVVDAPQPASTEVIETQIVNVESDNYRRAHEKARQQVARRYPGSQEILEAELSLTHQYLAGQ